MRKRKLAGCAVAAALSLAFTSPSAAVLEKSATIGGTTVRYKVVLPPGFDQAKTYPAVLAFPPGGQDMEMVDATLNGNYRAEAEKRGYIVVEPAAPNGVLFFEGSEKNLSGVHNQDFVGLPNRRREIQCRREFEWRVERFPDRVEISAIFRLGHRLPGLSR